MSPVPVPFLDRSISTVASPWRRGLWPAWIVVCVVAAGAATWAWQQAARLRSERQQLDAAAAVPMPVALPAMEEPDFAMQLPLGPADAAQLAGQLQQACRLSGVVLASLAAAQHAASPSELGRTQLDVELKGRYAAVKAVMAEMLDRNPRLTVSAFRLRADTNGSGWVQAVFTVTAWAQPVTPVAAPPAKR